ncbi:MAG: hypothetical protein V7L14_03765 [Nostoc sp.]|uniref:hypothetical protein n=1 Tax=Nostoc sp. TaxID=1180 RepID=UPI002FF8942F
MSNTAQEIYSQVVSNLSPTERLRLATLILNELVEQNLSITDQSDIWTEQDQLDLASFSLHYAASIDFLHKSKKEPHPAFNLRQSLPSPQAGRGWGWGVRGLLQEV